MRSGTALDSNVLIAAVAATHIHHAASSGLLLSRPNGFFGVAAHSLAETYVTLTRTDRAGAFHWSPEQANGAIAQIAARVRLMSLTPDQLLGAIHRYADKKGIGPRLYDALIGEAAAHAGLKRLVTWNISHMRVLFPQLEVMTPAEALPAAT